MIERVFIKFFINYYYIIYIKSKKNIFLRKNHEIAYAFGVTQL